MSLMMRRRLVVVLSCVGVGGVLCIRWLVFWLSWMVLSVVSSRKVGRYVVV